MRRLVATVLCSLIVATPALADAQTAPSTDGAVAKPKTKKICHAENNGNPLFPAMKCHIVPVETAKADEPAAPAKSTDMQVALAPQAAPH